MRTLLPFLLFLLLLESCSSKEPSTTPVESKPQELVQPQPKVEPTFTESFVIPRNSTTYTELKKLGLALKKSINWLRLAKTFVPYLGFQPRPNLD